MKAGRAAAFGRAVPGRRLCLSIVVSTPARAARRRPAPSLAPSEATRFPDTRALPGACETLETMTFDKTLSPSQRDARLNAYLRVTAPQGRVALRTGPFLATFDPRRDNPYRNYAVPDDGADPTPAEIEAFAEICRAHGRRPRLEYAPEAAPAQEAALVAAGGACFMAVDAAGGEAAGCGMFTPPADGVTEVAGIGVARAWRRRGLATALTSALTREAFRRGVTLAFLTPGGDEAQRAYERAGFEVGGSMLMIGR